MAGQVRRMVARLRRHLLTLAGAAAVVPLVMVEPALVVLLFDLESLALIGGVGFGMLRHDARLYARRLIHWFTISVPVLEVQAGWRLTRAEPRSLLRA